ncbi:MAG: hypothetical protein KAJ51_12065 [Thermoplasmata archaeon]|nr:hypothetical protein [Thermoplasmata archaeon]
MIQETRQQPGNTPTPKKSVRKASTITEIEKLKHIESSAIRKVKEAKDKANINIKKAHKKVKSMRAKALSNRIKELAQQETQAEEQAKVEAEQIKSQGIQEAEALKAKVSTRIPAAVNLIVQRIIGGD